MVLVFIFDKNYLPPPMTLILAVPMLLKLLLLANLASADKNIGENGGSILGSESGMMGPTVLITGAERGIGLGFVAFLVDTPGIQHIFVTSLNLEPAKFEHDLAKQREANGHYEKWKNSEKGSREKYEPPKKNGQINGIEHHKGHSRDKRSVSTESVKNDIAIEQNVITVRKRDGKGTVTIELIQMDVTDDQSIDQTVKMVEKRLQESSFEGLNLLINNAGILHTPTRANPEGRCFNPLHPDREVYLNHYNVNTMGSVMTTAKFLPLLKHANSLPAVVFVSSSVSSTNKYLGKRPHNNVAYAMSKAALNHYMRALANPEYAGNELISVAICPGWVGTEIGNRVDAPRENMVTIEEAVSKMMGRIGTLAPEDSGKFYSPLTYPPYGKPFEF